MRALTTLLIAGLLLVAGTATAGDRQRAPQHSAPNSSHTQGNARQDTLRLAQSNGLTLAQAIEQVKRQYKGRIVGAETTIKGNREVHRIRVLTEDGKVRTVTVQGRKLSQDRR